MKIKTSITLSEELVKEIDSLATSEHNRSAFLETAAWEYIAKLRRSQRNERDLALLNEHADRLNEEINDVVSYQIPL